MKLVDILNKVIPYLGIDYRSHYQDGSYVLLQDSGVLFKCLEFSRRKGKNSEIIGTIFVCAPDLYPLQDREIDLSNFRIHSQIICGYQSFARGAISLAPRNEKPFDISGMNEENFDRFQSVVRQCFAELDHMGNSKDLVAMIKARPRYSPVNVIKKKWLIAIWEGRISPDDQNEILKRDLAIEEFNSLVVSLGDYKAFNYEPGKLTDY